MKTFEYVRPATVPEAIAAVLTPGSAYLAAGTNLLDLMKGGAMRRPGAERRPGARPGVRTSLSGRR